jgi:tetratricopeptide (TPR) repeat protein
MRSATVVLAAAALAYASPVSAQGPTQADEQAAKAHFLAGSAYYEQANYTDAVKEFTEAHRLSRRPDLLYNISVCYERLGRWDDAIAALQQYLAERPDAPDRAVIESRIANFAQRRDAERAQPPPAPPPVAAPPPVVPPPARPRHVAGFVVGGVGLGLLVVALGTGVAAHLAYDDLGNKCTPMMVCNGGDVSLRNEANIGRALTLTTDVLLAVGGATLITGIALFIVESRRPASAHARLLPSASGLAVQF